MRRKKVLAFALSLAMVLSLVPASAMAATGTTDSDKLNVENYNGQWAYNADYNCYQLLSVPYCANPDVIDGEVKYQALNIYVPADYVKSFEDGKIVFDNTKVINGYTTDTAPMIYCNGASGWSEREVTKSTLPTYKLDEETGFMVADGGFGKALELNWYDCLENGYIVIGIGSRGRDSVDDKDLVNGDVPNNIVDAKAGVRFLKYNDAYLPGDSEKIISVGASGGGGMSAILAASGNSADYTSYLEEIGAVMTEDDTVFAAMCYCPITDLDNADMGYSWMYQNQLEYQARVKNPETGKMEKVTITFTDFEKALNADLAEVYEEYVENLGIGYGAENFDAYAMDVAAMFERSYEEYLVATFGADKAAAKEDASNYDWLTYDETTGKVTINGDTGREKLNLITENHNSRGKACPGFDIYDNTVDERAECNLFGTIGTADTAGHFSKSLANLLITNDEVYATKDGYIDMKADYAEALTDAMQLRAKMANPMYYIQEYANGDSNVQPAEHFRLIVGSSDSNTTPTVVFNLGKLIETAGIDVEYGYVWNQGHGTRDYDDINDELDGADALIAENHGFKAQTAFINWVNEIAAEPASDNTPDTTPDSGTATPGGDAQSPSTDTQKPADTNKPATGTSPQTGDVTSLPIAMVLAAIGAVAVASVRKRTIC